MKTGAPVEGITQRPALRVPVSPWSSPRHDAQYDAAVRAKDARRFGHDLKGVAHEAERQGHQDGAEARALKRYRLAASAQRAHAANDPGYER